MFRKDLIQPIRYVAENNRYVRINMGKIEEFVGSFKPVVINRSGICPFKYQELTNVKDEIDYRFLVDSQAFCFWGYPNKWTISYQGLKLDGWWAMLASFKKALEKGIPVLDGYWLAKTKREDIKNLYEGVPEIPLLQERWQILKETGKILAEKYQGRFTNFLPDKNINALDLLGKIVKEFPGFGDVHQYKGKKILFYKKAQLLVYDLTTIKGIEKIIRITNLADLTGKADYKIPAILREYGILEYTKELSNLVDSRKEISSGSEMEIEIRANMLWATELIVKELNKKGFKIIPLELDHTLWVLSQKNSPRRKPYHLTLTVDY